MYKYARPAPFRSQPWALLLTACASAAPFAVDPAKTTAPFERRAAAEWEPSMGLLVTWPLAHPKELVQAWLRDTDLYVVVANRATRAAAERTLTEWGADPARVHFIQRPRKEGLYGTRDWGPYAAFDEFGTLTLRDPRYLDYALSGYDSSKELAWWAKLDPRMDWTSDDETPVAIAAALSLPREELPFCFTGGNVELDGVSTAFSTEILADENRHFGVTKEQLLADVKRTLGIERLVFLPNFESELGAQHVDCLMKLLDEGRILVKRAPPDHPDHERIESIARILGGLESAWGRPYEILRIDTPRYEGNHLANYTNSLIHNRSVYVPLFGIPADASALEVYRAAMPGYDVKGFLAEGLTAWSYTDALHCRTKAVWDPRMIVIRHAPLTDRDDRAGPARVVARLWDYGKRGFCRDAVVLHWRREGDPDWTRTPMELADVPGRYEALLPEVEPGQTLEYYMSARTLDGREESHPRVAPRGFHRVRFR